MTSDERPVPRRHATGVARQLERMRAGLERLTPHQVVEAVAAGAIVIDTRTETQRAERGEFPGAIVIDRTVLEWRLDPTSPDCIPEANRDAHLIVICRQGYSSSLAASSLQAIGLHRATDMIGGVEAWQAAGLPMSTEPADVRR